jgi:hypothetical protein
MIRRNIAVFLVAATVLGGGALALAQGQPERPTTEPGSSKAPADPQVDRQARREAARKCRESAGEDRAKRQQCRQQFKQGRGKGGGPLRRAVHGDLVVPAEGGAFEKVTFDRGKVSQSSDPGRIVIDRPDGQQVTLALTPETRYRGIEGADQLRKGQNAVVTSRDGKALTVAQRDPGKTGPRSGNKEGGPGVPHD